MKQITLISIITVLLLSLVAMGQQPIIPTPISSELHIGEKYSLVHQRYDINLDTGQNVIILNDIPANADIASLILQDKRADLPLKYWRQTPPTSAEPAFHCTIDSPVEGMRRVDVIYCITGIMWGAHYQLEINGHDKTNHPSALTGHVSITNSTSHTFDETKIYLSASENKLYSEAKKAPGFLLLASSPLSYLWKEKQLLPQPTYTYPLPGTHQLLGQSTSRVPIIQVTNIFIQTLFIQKSQISTKDTYKHRTPFNKTFVLPPISSSLPPGYASVNQHTTSGNTTTNYTLLKNSFAGHPTYISLGLDAQVTVQRACVAQTKQGEYLTEQYHVIIENGYEWPINIFLQETPSDIFTWECIRASEKMLQGHGTVDFEISVNSKENKAVSYTIKKK